MRPTRSLLPSPPAFRRLAPLGGLGLALVVAACNSAPVVPGDSPKIERLARQDAPDPVKLPITPSDPIAPDPEKALDNYRELLKLDPDPALKAEVAKRVADLQVEVQDTRGVTDDAPAVLADSIRTYQQLLRDNPDSPDNDAIYYQMARAYQNNGQPEEAAAALQQLLAKYPASIRAGDARFRYAELLFRLNRYAEAEQEYAAVVALGDKTPFAEPAQYKQGWSQFKQRKFTDAIRLFSAILDRDLAPGPQIRLDDALKGVPRRRADIDRDSLQVIALAFAVQGGGQAVNDYYNQNPEPRFAPLVYTALGELFLEKKRFAEAADAFAAYIQRHPASDLAPSYQARVIAAYDAAGLDADVLREKERYATTYAPDAPYWAGRTPPPEVLALVRQYYEDVANTYYAEAQKARPPQPALFARAAGYYHRILAAFPQDPKRAEIRFLQAEALNQSGDPAAAATEYEAVAYDEAPSPRAADAAYAGALARFGRIENASPADKPGRVREAAASANKLAERYPQQPQRLALLTRAAQELFAIGDTQAAVDNAQRVLAANPPAEPKLRRVALGLVADARYAQADWAGSEKAYADLLTVLPAQDPARGPATERLAESVYRQGEALRTASDFRGAAAQFQRVGQVAPDSSLRPTADYDAAAALIAAGDYPAAITQLEAFRARYPNSPQAADVDKKLAVSYQQAGRLDQAAAAWSRIANRPGAKPEDRREALLLSARLYDDAGRTADAAKAYELYVGAYPYPLEPAVLARARVAEIYRRQNDPYRYLFWLRELVTADDNGGAGRTEATRLAAARAQLAIGTLTAADAAKLKLTSPLDKSLPDRKGAVEAAIQALDKAAGYGFASVSTEATYQLGEVYANLARDLNASERPAELKGEELEQYNLLLEEQSQPFADKAIATHEANLKRLAANPRDPAIVKSLDALARLAPAKYGKRERTEDRYEPLR